MNIEKQYLELLEKTLNGNPKSDRTGTGTISVFGEMLGHNMENGFPLLTTKKMYWHGIVTELLWFLKGDTSIKYLVDNNCNIWNGDCYKKYCDSHYTEPSNPGGPLLSDNLVSLKPIAYSKELFIEKIKTDIDFADKWGNLGPIYGKQWRQWNKITYNEEHRNGFYDPIDQISNVVEDIKNNPDSRRLVVSAWNVSELDKMVLQPCHYAFQFYTRELTWEEQVQWVFKNTDVEWENLYIVEEIAKESTPKRAISLMWNQRSSDDFLGLPYNIASYALLLEIIAKEVNMVPETLKVAIGDCHIYKNHIEQCKEQISREVFKLPKLEFTQEFYDIMDNKEYSFSDKINLFSPDMFKIKDYKSHKTIKGDLSN